MNLIINNKRIFKLFSCFILVFLCILVCVKYVFASSFLTAEQYISKANLQADYYIYVENYNYNDSHFIDVIGAYWDNKPSRVCALVTEPKGREETLYYIMSDTEPTNAFQLIGGDRENVTIMQNKTSNFEETSYGYVYRCYTHSNKFGSTEFNLLTFSSLVDAENYMLTGQINNALFEPEQKYEYSSDIEIPLMAQCQVNGDRFLFNCMQTESHNDYRLQINASVSLTPIYSNLTSKKYADMEQIFTSGKNEIGKYDNHDITFNVSFTTTDLLNGIDTSRTALGFKEFYNGYNILLPYKEATLSKIYFYARNVCGSKCSNWVKVTFDLITETSVYEEVESVSGSNVPSDTKKDSSEYYPSDYIYNDDEPYQGDNNGGILGYIKNGLGLVGNNSIIALIGNTFSFLPRELTTLLLFGGALLVAVGIIKVVTR